MPLPTFIIIGATRSGTTFLARSLGRHPDVFMTPRKELHFFDDHHAKGPGYYERCFEGAHQIAVGEATPNYLYDPEAIRRMAQLIPQVRLVAILRDPVDRAYSHYWMVRARRQEPLPFEEAVEREPERLQAGPESRRRHSYLDRGKYLRQLQHVTRHFPRSSLHVAIFEDLVESPRTVLSAVCTFLGVDPQALPDDPASRPANAYVAFRSPRLRRWTRRLPPPVRNAIGRINTKDEPYPPMPPHIRSRLRDHFLDENRALQTWLGRDLSRWDRRLASPDAP